jgi:hypothetical protein
MTTKSQSEPGRQTDQVVSNLEKLLLGALQLDADERLVLVRMLAANLGYRVILDQPVNEEISRVPLPKRKDVPSTPKKVAQRETASGTKLVAPKEQPAVKSTPQKTVKSKGELTVQPLQQTASKEAVQKKEPVVPKVPDGYPSSAPKTAHGFELFAKGLMWNGSSWVQKPGTTVNAATPGEGSLGTAKKRFKRNVADLGSEKPPTALGLLRVIRSAVDVYDRGGSIVWPTIPSTYVLGDRKLTLEDPFDTSKEALEELLSTLDELTQSAEPSKEGSGNTEDAQTKVTTPTRR